MDREQFDALARLVWSQSSRRAALGALLGAALLGASAPLATAKPKDKRQRRQRKQGNQTRRYPVFTTCHTETEELGPIPGGPYPTCRSRYDPDEFEPCNRSLTFRDLQERCNQEYAQCAGDCRILSEPTIGLGDCPDYVDCVYEDSGCNPHSVGKIPGGPYGSCWSWWNPFMRCWQCRGAHPDYNEMVNLCGVHYPDCREGGQNICQPYEAVGRLARPGCPTG